MNPHVDLWWKKGHVHNNTLLTYLILYKIKRVHLVTTTTYYLQGTTWPDTSLHSKFCNKYPSLKRRTKCTEVILHKKHTQIFKRLNRRICDIQRRSPYQESYYRHGLLPPPSIPPGISPLFVQPYRKNVCSYPRNITKNCKQRSNFYVT